MKAKLILENGMVFEGNAFGHLKDSVGEVVFTTGMTGYEEVLTDPSYNLFISSCCLITSSTKFCFNPVITL